MKTRWMIALVAMAAVGMLAGQAGAAVELVVKVELAPAETGKVSPTDGNVLLDVWCYFASANGSYADDGLSILYGALKSSNGGLLGDLVFAMEDTFKGTSYQNGMSQDLDFDTDNDVGGTNTQAITGWIVLNAGATVFAPPTDANRVLLGHAVFTLTDTSADIGDMTLVNWSYMVKTGIGNSIDAYKVDGTSKTVTGSDSRIAAGEAVEITFVPEPATMALLACENP